jgi:hypothetical protein
LVEVKYRHSFLRRLLLPIYGPDQAIFTAVVISLVALVCFSLEPAAAPYVIGGSIIGGWLKSYPHAPVSVRVPNSRRVAATRILDTHWHRAETGDCWVPRASRWRRWGYVKICLKDASDGELIISGPRANVLALVADLQANAQAA